MGVLNACTLGFWRQEQHFDSWVGFSPDDIFNDVFLRNAFSDELTLLDALEVEEPVSPLERLARQSVAALLNASNDDVNFPLDPGEVIDAFQEAFDTGDEDVFTQTALQLDNLNNIGPCPLD